MKSIDKEIIVVFDDRESTNDSIANIVGSRKYGQILFKRHSLFEYFKKSLPAWAIKNLIRINNDDDLANLKSKLNDFEKSKSIFIVNNKAGFLSSSDLRKLFERLPYAEEDFVDRISNPLIFYFHDSRDLIKTWSFLEKSPTNKFLNIWKDKQTIKSIEIADLSDIGQFLNFISGATATRHFNNLEINDFYIEKESIDIEKMKSEYLFYHLVPEQMKPWLAPTFDYLENDKIASYKMMRYFLADASLQWVHDAFSRVSFQYFIKRLLFFIHKRPKKLCTKKESLEIANSLFLNKVNDRIQDFLSLKEGLKVNHLAKKINPNFDVNVLFKRYLDIFNKEKNKFKFDYKVIGHGDPCLSNILYDCDRRILILVDPKGAQNIDQIWTHPLYDLCKISHSIMGDYDFINSGLYDLKLLDDNNVELVYKKKMQNNLKEIFIDQITYLGYDFKAIRIAEISLFLSMLPLHIDIPNKVLAFLIKASEILDYLENG